MTMIRFLITSIFLRVAVGLAALMAGALYFVATQFTPEATFVTASGDVRHVFLAPDFIRQVVMAWVVLLPVVYILTRAVIWMTADKQPPRKP